MAHKPFLLNPGQMRRLISAKTSASADCAGWLVRVKPGHNVTVPTLECCWFVLRGNLLFYCDDPESEPRGLIVLENHCVELYDSLEEYESAFTIHSNIADNAGKSEPVPSSLKDYFAFLNLYTTSDDKTRKDKKMLLSDISVAASAMQYAFRIFFPDSPTQEPLILIADSDQSLQMWMRAVALASHAARQILATTKKPVVVDSLDSSTASSSPQVKIILSEQSFSEMHDHLRQVVLHNTQQVPSTSS